MRYEYDRDTMRILNRRAAPAAGLFAFLPFFFFFFCLVHRGYAARFFCSRGSNSIHGTPNHHTGARGTGAPNTTQEHSRSQHPCLRTTAAESSTYAGIRHAFSVDANDSSSTAKEWCSSWCGSGICPEGCCGSPASTLLVSLFHLQPRAAAAAAAARTGDGEDGLRVEGHG